jgi:hypothetical protein
MVLRNMGKTLARVFSSLLTTALDKKNVHAEFPVNAQV